ncbi:protein-tyrosine phosphatase-like protein [Triangularia setosa]|uniref:protein-tyrosine-phosphatase n=1 Tax=Triangularia setosa TaxID=2587417 RepID=A0AAN7A8Q9_9PEZI|nr:protein-tyrosine phosphatase-like protein [Podospora setosa]
MFYEVFLNLSSLVSSTPVPVTFSPDNRINKVPSLTPSLDLGESGVMPTGSAKHVLPDSNAPESRSQSSLQLQFFADPASKHLTYLPGSQPATYTSSSLFFPSHRNTTSYNMTKKKNKHQSSTPLPTTTTTLPTVSPILLPHLYLSPASATSLKSTPSLLSHGITTIISVGRSPLSQHPDITYHRLPLLDSENVPLGPTVRKACEIIDEVEKKGGKVLVHCSAGISRSPAVVAGYLMLKKGMGLEVAMSVIKKGRGVVRPNRGFMGKLAAMQEGMGGGDVESDAEKGEEVEDGDEEKG